LDAVAKAYGAVPHPIPRKFAENLTTVSRHLSLRHQRRLLRAVAQPTFQLRRCWITLQPTQADSRTEPYFSSLGHIENILSCSIFALDYAVGARDEIQRADHFHVFICESPFIENEMARTCYQAAVIATTLQDSIWHWAQGNRFAISGKRPVRHQT
jgi:hypothetical protein